MLIQPGSDERQLRQFKPERIASNVPVGQISLYIQKVVPQTLLLRQLSISVLRKSNWPIMLWYSCRLNATCEQSSKSGSLHALNSIAGTID